MEIRGDCRISPLHCVVRAPAPVVQPAADSIVLHNYSICGTWLNDIHLEKGQTAQLKEGDQIVLAQQQVGNQTSFVPQSAVQLQALARGPVMWPCSE
jgi:hypothetical protein